MVLLPPFAKILRCGEHLAIALQHSSASNISYYLNLKWLAKCNPPFYGGPSFYLTWVETEAPTWPVFSFEGKEWFTAWLLKSSLILSLLTLSTYKSLVWLDIHHLLHALVPQRWTCQRYSLFTWNAASQEQTSLSSTSTWFDFPLITKFYLQSQWTEILVG